MNLLSEIYDGAFGEIYWYQKAERELSEEQIANIRQKAISDTINATLTNLMYEPSKAVQSLDGVYQRGWNDAAKQIKMLEDGTIMKGLAVMIGIGNVAKILNEIESTPGFRGWMNPHIISEIKAYYLNTQ